MKIKQFDWFILMINTKIKRRKFKLKKWRLDQSASLTGKHQCQGLFFN